MTDSVNRETIRAMMDGIDADTAQMLLQDLIQSLQNDIDRFLVEMRNAAETNDAAKMIHAAHGLKGSCANMGLEPVAAFTRELELNARSGQVADEEQIQHLEAMLVEAVTDLRELKLNV